MSALLPPWLPQADDALSRRHEAEWLEIYGP
jgi:hypothetical protein